jgi:3-oxoacyl-[acyl-carrier protein] reductase
MDLGLKDKSVIVMAGSQGIGLATAVSFAREGALVTICARGEEALNQAAEAIGDCESVVADVTKPDDIESVVAAARSRFGGVDVLINNAGGPPPGPFDALEDGQWQQAVELTLMSAVRATRAVLPDMKAKQWGRIVNISSYGVKQPVSGLTLSNSIRMAVLGWAKTLSQQIGLDSITVNTVCPGWTRTARAEGLIAKQAADKGVKVDQHEKEMTMGIPLRRLGEAAEVADLAVFLASERAAYITGTAIQVDGGIVGGYA